MKLRVLYIIVLFSLLFTGCSKTYARPQVNESSAAKKADKSEKDIADKNIEISNHQSIKTEPEGKVTPKPEIPQIKPEEGPKKMLNGKIICVDPGHGNPNHPVKNEPIAPSSNVLKPATAYGTTGVVTKIPEYKLTLAVSLKIRDKLIENGAKVFMTRDTNDVDLGNIERSEIANKIPADISIRIHADGFDNSSVSGISVLYPGSQYINDTQLLNKSKVAAQLTLNEIINATHGKSRGIVERNDLTGFNWTKVPVILVEMGFMTNPEEDQRLNTDEYQGKIAEGIVNGLIKYFTGEK